MSKREKKINLSLEILMWLFTITIIYPILMVVITSFKEKKEASYLNIKLPREWNLGRRQYTAGIWKQYIYYNFFSSSGHCTCRYVQLCAGSKGYPDVQKNIKAADIWDHSTVCSNANYGNAERASYLRKPDFTGICIWGTIPSIFGYVVFKLYQRNTKRIG